MRRIVHIGANKTASTLLQRRLFARHPLISYLGEDCPEYSSRRAVLETLVKQDASYYDEISTSRLFASAAAVPGKSVMLFSSEDILTASHPSVCAARLARLMPGATIVLVLRNQLTTWPSWYINHGAYLKGVPRRYWRKHVGFDEWLDYCFAFPDQTPVEAMNYLRHIEIFQRAFGLDSVRVLLYEDLIHRPVHYFAQWGDLLGVPEQDVAGCLDGQRERTRNTQRRFRFEQLCGKLPLGLLARHIGSWLDQGPAALVNLPTAWDERIRTYYSAGNSALAQTFSLDLKAYDYPLL